MQALIKWLFGGRPMKVLEWRFNDAVQGGAVYLCEDRYGRRWLANGAWSLFRVKPLYEETDGYRKHTERQMAEFQRRLH